MAPRKKKIETEIITSENEEILLDKGTVWDVLTFARNLVGGMYPGLITPDLINARMKDVSYSPLAATSDSLNRALANPKESEESLRSFIENFEIVSMPFKRILSYMSSHLSMDLQYTVTNPKVDYKSTKFKTDQSSVYGFFDKFDHKYYFRNAIKQMLRNELYFASVRDEGNKIVLQELPLQFCKVTARWDYGLLASFNFYYFLMPGIDIDLFHPFFKKKFNEIHNGRNREYNPSLPVELRGNSQDYYWVDLPPDVCWVFKLDTSLITAVPYFTGMMPLLVDEGIMRGLQKDINMASASKMLFGEVPLLKDTKASVKDMIAIDPQTLGQFLSLVKSSLGNAVKLGSAPLQNMTAISFDGNDELLDKWTRTMMSNSGMDTSLLYSSQVKANLIDSQLSFESDSKIVEQQLYPQMALFLDYWANKNLKHYKYVFRLEGNDYYLNRQQRFDRAIQLAGLGMVMPQLFSSSLGLKPQEFYRMLEESKALEFVDKLTPIIPGSQLSGKENGQGRPQKSDDELGDSGAQTRETGGNIASKGGKI